VSAKKKKGLFNQLMSDDDEDMIEETVEMQAETPEEANEEGQPASPPPPVEKPKGPPSVISSEMVIEGTVRSASDIQMMGKIKGDVTCAGDILCTNAIEGNIICNNLNLEHCAVAGDVKVKGNFDMDERSVLVGDVQAGAALIAGKIKGNVTIKQDVEIKKSAVVYGNIIARSISIEAEAQVNGKLEVYERKVEDSVFKMDMFDKKEEKKEEELPKSELTPTTPIL